MPQLESPKSATEAVCGERQSETASAYHALLREINNIDELSSRLLSQVPSDLEDRITAILRPDEPHMTDKEEIEPEEEPRNMVPLAEELHSLRRNLRNNGTRKLQSAVERFGRITSRVEL